MAKPDVIHVKATSSWWDGSSTMLCGLKIQKFQGVSRLFNSVTCPTCKSLYKNGK